VKHILITTIAAVVLVGCDEAQPPEPPTAKTPDISIHLAAEEGNIEAVKQHLAAGTDVDVKGGSMGGTPLHYAASRGHKGVVELLIDKGAEVNPKEGVSGGTPLLWAAGSGHKEIVEMLIVNGADVNAKEKFGWTALDWAENDEIADLLRKHGGKTAEELKAEGK